MKVEVSKIKKPGIKVSVTLARSGHRKKRISIPVRPAARIDSTPDVDAAANDAETVIGFAPGIEDKLAAAAEAVESFEPDCDEEAFEAAADAVELLEDAPDEEDLLALIAEEEAEMASQFAQNSDTAFDPDELFTDEAVIAGEELFSAEADSVIEEPSADAIDPVAGDFFGEVVNEAADQPAEDAAEQPTQVEQYMRYFDRSDDGEKVEVSDLRTNAQEIICVDGESGRLSRVCGFIKNDQSAQSPDDEQLAEQE